jgi:hypothetical protein
MTLNGTILTSLAFDELAVRLNKGVIVGCCSIALKEDYH